MSLVNNNAMKPTKPVKVTKFVAECTQWPHCLNFRCQKHHSSNSYRSTKCKDFDDCKTWDCLFKHSATCPVPSLPMCNNLRCMKIACKEDHHYTLCQQGKRGVWCSEGYACQAEFCLNLHTAIEREFFKTGVFDASLHPQEHTFDSCLGYCPYVNSCKFKGRCQFPHPDDGLSQVECTRTRCKDRLCRFLHTSQMVNGKRVIPSDDVKGKTFPQKGQFGNKTSPSGVKTAKKTSGGPQSKGQAREGVDNMSGLLKLEDGH